MTVNVHIDLGAGLSEITGRTVLPARFTATYTDPDPLLPTFEVDIAVIDGSPVVEGVRVTRSPGGPSLTGSELARLPTAYIVEHAATQVAGRRLSGTAVELPALRADPPARESVDDVRQTVRRRRIDRDLLAEVARIYREHEASGAPTARVSELLHVSAAQASRYVRQARQAGLLELPEVIVRSQRSGFVRDAIPTDMLDPTLTVEDES